jgi:hypothetical protein
LRDASVGKGAEEAMPGAESQDNHKVWVSQGVFLKQEEHHLKVKLLLLLLLLSFVITKKTEGKFICIHVLYVAQKDVDAVIYYIDIATVSNTKEKFNKKIKKKKNREREF